MTTFSMPSPALPYPAGNFHDALPWRTLGALTLAVLLAHWVLLGGLPSLLPSWQTDGRLAGSQSTEAFITRTIAPASDEALPQTPAMLAEPPTEVLQPLDVVEPLAAEEIAPLPPIAQTSISQPLPFGEDGDEVYGIAGLADDASPLVLAIPSPTRLDYDVKGEIKGIPYSAKAEMVWKHDGKNYDARLQFVHWIASRTQTSKGALTAQGLEPLRFGDKVRSEVAAHFEREKGKVSFSANTPDVPLTPGAQDQLSVFVQLAALFGGNPKRLTPGVTMSFQAIGPRSSETWVFKVGMAETLKLPGGEISAIKVVRDSVNENDARAELWLAPAFGYLPVRIRLTQGSSDFVDQLWRSTQNP
ncbi:MAG: DUF3108 domain-containing protein [Rhodoferax sp.]|nr:DUF3108 domain-containing protein [Rhodoferax sp.]